jgi:hypothetical protein
MKFRRKLLPISAETSCALKMEATGSSETVVLIYYTAQYNFPEDGRLMMGCFQVTSEFKFL